MPKVKVQQFLAIIPGMTMSQHFALRRSFSLKMPHRIVAAEACELPAARYRVRCFDSTDNFLMTVTTGLLGDLKAVRLDLNIILVAPGGEEK